MSKIYHLKREILEKIPHFVDIINKVGNSSVEIFVDRSSLLFDHILSYVMDNSYPIDCYEELDYYRITYNRYKTSKTELCLAKDSIENEIDKIRYKLNDMYDDINKINTKLDDIKSIGGRKLCKVSDCGDYVTGEDTNYCYNHVQCTRCYEDANRSNNFLCSIHQNY